MGWFLKGPKTAQSLVSPKRYIQKHLLNGNLVAGGVDDEEVAINGDEEDREGGEEDTSGLNYTGRLAKDFLKVKSS